jgi:hypothetical protein
MRGSLSASLRSQHVAVCGVNAAWRETEHECMKGNG